MEWNVQSLLTGSAFTALLAIIANAMGWIRFKKKDNANVDKIKSATALDIAEVTQKRIQDEVKISDAALQWTVNLASQLEKANSMIEKKQIENDRLYGIIDTMKDDFERDFEKLKSDFNTRIQQLERELEISRLALAKEREINMIEIERLKKQIDDRI